MRLAQRAVRVPPGSGLVLAYHLVGGETGAEVDLQVSHFERHLDQLEAECEIVSLAQLVSSPRADRLQVALTFDDAFANFADVVWPILAKRGLPATLFVPTGFVDGLSGCPLSSVDLRPCSWAALRDMQSEGLVCGSHTHLHRNLRRLSSEDVEWELATAKRRLCEELDEDVEDFCYPQAKWCRRVATLVRKYHERAVIGSGRHVGREPDRLAIPRIPVRRGQRDITPVLRTGLWMEEWVADKLRQHR